MSLAIIETNEVHLIGRLAEEPVHKTMSSGQATVQFRIVVRRPPAEIRRQNTDSIDCVSYRGAAIKASTGWVAGDVFELRGALQHRFWRAGGAIQSAYEVDVRTIRRLARAPAAKPRRRRETAGVA